MREKYKKISSNDVIRVLISISLDIMAPVDNITLVNIASLLNTSRYQVKKHIDKLVKFGIAEYSVQTIYDTDEVIPPICGYRLADMIREKSGDNIPPKYDRTFILQKRAMYQREKAKTEKLLIKCFGS